MLSEQEKEWLERRKNLCGRCVKRSFCRTGKTHGYNTEACRFWEIKTPNGYINNDFRDAAEFEARVAEKLAKSICVVCSENKNGRFTTRQNYTQRADIEACRMRHARIAVESEAISTWNDLPRALEWSSDPPTEPGFWWWELLGHKGVDLIQDPEKRVVKDYRAKWAGPIPEPKEAKR